MAAVAGPIGQVADDEDFPHGLRIVPIEDLCSQQHSTKALGVIGAPATTSQAQHAMTRLLGSAVGMSKKHSV